MEGTIARMKPRVHSLDLIRVLATVMVVVVHTRWLFLRLGYSAGSFSCA